MRSGLRIGSVFGIPFYLHPTWFIILALFTLAKAVYWQERFPEWGTAMAWGTGLAASLLLFSSVLLHELGHSLVALSQGIQVNSISLFLFGGVAAIERESKTPGQAFQVAIAGPGVSFALFLLLTGILSLLPETTSPMRILAENLASVNLILCLFNLIPGLPLDGGQVLKAAVWKWTGNRFTAVRVAAKTGQFLGVVTVALGAIAFGFAGTGGLWIAFIGWFIFRNASAYDRLSRLQEVLLQTTINEAKSKGFRVIDARMSLGDFVGKYLLSSWDSNGKRQDTYPYYAASEGRYRGAIAIEKIREMERSAWETEPVASIVLSFDDIPTVTEKMSLAAAIDRLERDRLDYLTVLSPAGAVAGVVDRGDIVETVANKLGIALPKTEIDRVKSEGTYPTGLPLNVIAKATIAEES